LKKQKYTRDRVMVLNAIFYNIPAISWRSVLLVEETGEPGENHRPLPRVENRVENAQVIATGLDVVNDVHVVMYNGKLYMEFIVYTVIGL
jgi:hypothetical protein